MPLLNPTLNINNGRQTTPRNRRGKRVKMPEFRHWKLILLISLAVLAAGIIVSNL